MGHSRTPAPLVLVDAGASHTRAVVARADGGVLAWAEAGGANPFAAGRPAAASQLGRALRAALARARQPAASIRLAAIGSAGVGTDGTGQRATARLLRARLPRARLLVEADVATALRSALAGAPGVVAIAGTGTIVLGRAPSGRTAAAGGWGWLLGDEGSAQWLGRQAVAAAARAADGCGPRTALATRLPRAANAASLWQLALAAYRARWGPAEFGRLAPLVTAAAAGGDAVAGELIAAAMTALAAQIASVVGRLRLRAPRVSYQGSVFRAGAVVLDPLRRALLTHGLDLRPPALPPLAGSLLLALEALGLPAAPAVGRFIARLPPALRGLEHA